LEKALGDTHKGEEQKKAPGALNRFSDTQETNRGIHSLLTLRAQKKTFELDDSLLLFTNTKHTKATFEFCLS